MSPRIIREHTVYGRAIVVQARSEADAVDKARRSYGDMAWETKQLSPGQWEVYMAKHEDCFALND